MDEQRTISNSDVANGGFVNVRDNWQAIGELEKRRAAEVLDSGGLSIWSGPIFDEFCEATSRMSGHRYVVPVNNGTMALILAGAAAGIVPGDEVIVPGYGYMATAAPIVLLGATPVFCDIDADTLTLDPRDLERKVTGRTRAVMVTHSWGNPADMPAISDVANRHGVLVIGDCSHAHGAEVGGRPLGGWATISCYSMSLGKLVTGGELGAVTTDDEDLYERLVLLGSVKGTGALRRYRVNDALPFKSRPHGVALAIGTASLARLDERNRGLRRFGEGVLAAVDGLRWLIPQRQLPGSTRTYYRVVLRADESIPLDGLARLRANLRGAGVPLTGEEYAKPLTTWDTITGTSFLTAGRFAPPPRPRVALAVTDAVVTRTLHFRGFADPSPPDLAARIGQAVRTAAHDLGLGR